MKEYTVTYYLTLEQEAAIKEMADEAKTTVEFFFERIMNSGSRWDIDKKIEDRKWLAEHSKRNRDAPTPMKDRLTAGTAEAASRNAERSPVQRDVEQEACR